MTGEIRQAVQPDARELAELRWEFRSGKTLPTETHEAFVDRCATWMSLELARGAWRAWVAAQDGRIVGQIWLQVLSKLPNPADELEQHAYISNFYVTPSARGGVGAQLLQTALDWARSNRIDRVVLWPTARSRTIYERHGFCASGDVLELISSSSASTRP